MKTFAAWSLRPSPEGSVVIEPAADVMVQRLCVDAPVAAELLRALRSARESLLDRPVREIASVLGAVGGRFLDPEDDLRKEAIELLPSTAGLSREMAIRTLDGIAAEWRTDRLEKLLDVELEGGAALDRFVESGVGRKSRALGAPLTVHVCAGTVPGVSVTSMLRALLVKSAVLLKPGRADVVLPVLFRRGLAESDARLAAAAAVVYWPGGSGEPLESAALEQADLVVVYGDDESVRAVRGRAAGTTPVVAHPHRVSLGVVGGVAGSRSAPTLEAAALAVALFDQRGCVSPHLFYVLGDERPARLFAEAVAGKLQALERELPSAPLDERGAAALHQLRGTAELLSAAGRGALWRGEGTTWTVVWDPDPGFEPSCLGRTVRVKAVGSVEALLGLLRPYHRHLQTVGVAGLDSATLSGLAEGLARLGPIRVAPLESAPWPPPWWHHDGMAPLGSLLRWSDLEEGID